MHTITPSITSAPSPVVSETFNQIVNSGIEPVTDHLLSNALPDHMQQSAIEKQMPNHSPLANQINQQSLQDQLSQSTVDHISCIENHLHPGTENNMIPPAHVDGHVLQPPVDDDVTQPCIGEEYTGSLGAESNALSSTLPNVLPGNNHNNLPIVNDTTSEADTQNCTLQNEVNQTVNQQSDSNLFDSLNNGEILSQNHSTENILSNDQVDDNEHQKKNELPISDDEDDYGAPGSVGPVSMFINFVSFW